MHSMLHNTNPRLLKLLRSLARDTLVAQAAQPKGGEGGKCNEQSFASKGQIRAVCRQKSRLSVLEHMAQSLQLQDPKSTTQLSFNQLTKTSLHIRHTIAFYLTNHAISFQSSVRVTKAVLPTSATMAETKEKKTAAMRNTARMGSQLFA